MLMNAVDQDTGFIMTHIIIQWSVIIAQMSTSVNGATCLLVKSENVQINKLLPLEAKDISLWASAPSNGYGVRTPEDHMST